MPSFDKHCNQYKHNLELIKWFEEYEKSKEFSDWYVTISFYSVLHMVEALIFKLWEKNKHIKLSNKDREFSVKIKHAKDASKHLNTKSPHYSRGNIIRNNEEEFRELSDQYSTLKELSDVARYKCWDTDNHNYSLAKEFVFSAEESFRKMINSL